jgi:hypothetical protein
MIILKLELTMNFKAIYQNPWSARVALQNEYPVKKIIEKFGSYINDKDMPNFEVLIRGL